MLKALATPVPVTEREALVAFLEQAATARDMTELNIAAGIALQALGEIAPDLG